MIINNSESFENLRIAGALAADTLDEVSSYVKPGVTTNKLDKICYEYIRDNGGYSAPLFYRGFPKSCCTSVNHVVCHGIPSEKRLQNGDIINVDVTVIVNGWHGDSSRMFYVGKSTAKARRLIDITYEAMMLGIAAAGPNSTLGDIGHAIQSYAESHRCSVVRDFCGHGIGRIFHDSPNVVHYGEAGSGLKLEQGMIFTIEPMINLGTWQVKLLKDGWTAVTKDRSLSAQFEHSIGITADGVEIFTLSPAGHTKPPYD